MDVNYQLQFSPPNSNPHTTKFEVFPIPHIELIHKLEMPLLLN